jgi:hypothetical protein
MTTGVRAHARLTLVDDPDPSRAWAALASGSKSLLFQFSAMSESQPELVSLGAMVTTSDQRPLAWGEVDREVLLNFWDDAARMHVHEAAEFTVWYSRTIGSGVITAVLGDLFDAPVGS